MVYLMLNPFACRAGRDAEPICCAGNSVWILSSMVERSHFARKLLESIVAEFDYSDHPEVAHISNLEELRALSEAGAT